PICLSESYINNVQIKYVILSIVIAILSIARMVNIKASNFLPVFLYSPLSIKKKMEEAGGNIMLRRNRFLPVLSLLFLMILILSTEVVLCFSVGWYDGNGSCH